MEQLSSIEDERGVDIGQIRRQLNLPVHDRVRTMVEAANVMLSMQRAAMESLRRQAR